MGLKTQTGLRVVFAQGSVLIAILGIIAITGELAHQTATPTFLARRAAGASYSRNWPRTPSSASSSRGSCGTGGDLRGAWSRDRRTGAQPDCCDRRPRGLPLLHRARSSAGVHATSESAKFQHWQAGSALAQLRPSVNAVMLTQLQGGLVLICWAALLAALGTRPAVRRDIT